MFLYDIVFKFHTPEEIAGLNALEPGMQGNENNKHYGVPRKIQLSTWSNNTIEDYFYDLKSKNFVKKNTTNTQLNIKKLTQNLKSTVVEKAKNFTAKTNKALLDLNVVKRDFTISNNVSEETIERLI